MAATNGIRIQDPMEPSGLLYGPLAAKSKYGRYGVSAPLVSSWINRGAVLAELRDGVMVIDEKSLRAYVQDKFRPTKNTQASRARSERIEAQYISVTIPLPLALLPQLTDEHARTFAGHRQSFNVWLGHRLLRALLENAAIPAVGEAPCPPAPREARPHRVIRPRFLGQRDSP